MPWPRPSGCRRGGAVVPYTGAEGCPGGRARAAVVVDGRVRLDVVDRGRRRTRRRPSTTVEDDPHRRARRAPDALVGGAAAETLDTQGACERDLRVIVPVVLLVIGSSSCCCSGRSSRPLLLLVANVLSFAAALGVSALVFNHVLGYPGADPVVPLYAFVFLVALGVDYSIFLMTRVREESDRVGHPCGRRPWAGRDGRRHHVRRRGPRDDVRGARRSSRCCSSRRSRSSWRSGCCSTRSSCAACSSPPWCTTSTTARGGRARCRAAPHGSTRGADLE